MTQRLITRRSLLAAAGAMALSKPLHAFVAHAGKAAAANVKTSSGNQVTTSSSSNVTVG